MTSEPSAGSGVPKVGEPERSAVADNNSFEQWRDEGTKDAPQRASERCKRLIAEYQQPKLDPAVDEELREFVSRRKAERPDQWH